MTLPEKDTTIDSLRFMAQIKYVVGDITEQRVDAIVNAANTSLLGGGGVDGAIHMVAGPELYEECLLIGGCDYGEAKITKGYNLPAKHVIHTVGPIYGEANGREEEVLANCYRNSLLLAKEHGLKSIAFPAISTGAFCYPKAEAASVAVRTATTFLKEFKISDMEILFVLLTPWDAAHYEKWLTLSIK